MPRTHKYDFPVWSDCWYDGISVWV